MAKDDLSYRTERYRSKQPAQSSRGLTRRRVLALLGAGVVSASAIGSSSADSHEAEVRMNGGTWIADAHGSQVYSGGSMFSAIQAAIDNLSSGRSSKETVIVWDDGSGSGQITLPSYTILDVRGTISNSGDIPIYADGAQSIEIPNYTVTGSPDMGMRLQRCSDVILGDISVTGAGIGVRIDNAYETGNPVTTTNVQIDYAHAQDTGSHGVETYGVDDITIGTVETVDTGGCGLLLNETSNASVDVVDALRADQGGGYAGFRCANDAGPNILANEVRAVDCGRGFFTVSGSYGITIEQVYTESCGSNLIQDTRDMEINGGTIEDNGGEGVRIDSRDSSDHHHTRDVTIQNVGIYGNDHGVLETGPDTESNAILNNDFCDNGTDIETYSSSTTVSGNTYCEGKGGSSGPISTGTYYITNVNSGLLLEVAGADTSDGANVQQWSDRGGSNQQWYVEETSDGSYRIENVNSGKVMDVEGASSDDGANVLQWSDDGSDNQRWWIREDGSGEYAIEAVHSGKVADVEGASTDDGANVLQWTDSGGSNQRWYFDSV